MTAEEIKSFCEEVFLAERLTEDQIRRVKELSEEYRFDLNPKCLDCYKDAVVYIYNQAGKPEGSYKLKPGTDVIFGGHRVNELTLTDTLAEHILNLGFNPNYFEKLPTDENKR